MKLYELLSINDDNLFVIYESAFDGEGMKRLTDATFASNLLNHTDIIYREVEYFHVSILNKRLIINVCVEEQVQYRLNEIEDDIQLVQELHL